MTHPDLEQMEATLRAGTIDDTDAAAAAGRLAHRAEAEGLVDVAYADVGTPIGDLVVASTRRGLVRVSFVPEARDKVLQELA